MQPIVKALRSRYVNTVYNTTPIRQRVELHIDWQSWRVGAQWRRNKLAGTILTSTTVDDSRYRVELRYWSLDLHLLCFTLRFYDEYPTNPVLIQRPTVVPFRRRRHGLGN